MNRLRTALTGALLAPLLLAGAACGATDDAAVTVNGSEISRDSLESELSAVSSNTDYASALGIAGEANGTLDAEFVAEHLTLRIYFRLVAEELDRRGEEPGQSDRDQALPQVLAQLGGDTQGGEADQRAESVFRSFPQEFQDDQLQRWAEVVRLATVLAEAFQGEEGERFVESHPDIFEQRCISHLLVATEEEALDARARVVDDGEDFADVASEVSQDTASAQTGGELACNTRSQAGYVEEFAEAAYSLEEGEVSEPVETEFGFHVITVTEIIEADFDQIGVQVAQQALDLWLLDATANADVDVDPRYGRWEIGGPEVGGRGMVVPPEGPTTTVPDDVGFPGDPIQPQP